MFKMSTYSHFETSLQLCESVPDHWQRFLEFEDRLWLWITPSTCGITRGSDLVNLEFTGLWQLILTVRPQPVGVTYFESTINSRYTLQYSASFRQSNLT